MLDIKIEGISKTNYRRLTRIVGKIRRNTKNQQRYADKAEKKKQAKQDSITAARNKILNDPSLSPTKLTSLNPFKNSSFKGVNS